MTPLALVVYTPFLGRVRSAPREDLTHTEDALYRLPVPARGVSWMIIYDTGPIPEIYTPIDMSA